MDPTGALDILGLKWWPFNVVPDANKSLIWADRAGLLTQVTRLLRRLSINRSSSLNLLWADFGAGKTHTLLYIRQLAQTGDYGQMLSSVATLPRGSRTFLDIYRTIVRAIGVEPIVESYRSLESTGSSEQVRYAFSDSQNLPPVLKALDIGNDMMKEVASRWLLADPSLSRAELRSVSIPDRIRTTDDALYALVGLVRLFLSTSAPRVLIMIDEFQRTGTLRRADLNEINAGLHSFFNMCPEGLSLFLSFSFGTAANIKAHLSPELESRADPQILTIPSLDKENSKTLISDLLANACVEGATAPFGEDVTDLIVNLVAEGGPITPRRLMHLASFILAEASLDLADGVTNRVDSDYAARIVDSLGPPPDESENER